MATPHEHVVQFYEDAGALAATVAGFLAQGLTVGEPALVIATAPHRHAIEARLAADGVDTGRLILLDAHATLAAFLRDGAPDPALFEAEVGGMVARLAAKTGRLRAYGEMVDVLWSDGERGAALRLEELWNDLQARHPFTLLCAYAMASFYKEPAGLDRVCATHTRVAGLEHTRRAEIEIALRETVRDLRGSEARFREQQRLHETITDALPVLVAFVDASGRYSFVSAAYERWFRHAKADMVGKHLADVLGPAAYATIRPHVEAALSGTTAHFESAVPYRDAGTRFVTATYIPQFDRDGRVTGFVSLVGDVTERKAFEHYRAAAAERAERLLKITSALATAVTTAEVLEAVVDHVGAAIDASSIALWLLDGGGAARLARSVGLDEDTARRFHVLPLDGPPTPALDALRRGEPVWIASADELARDYPSFADTASRDPHFRVSCLPLASNRGTLGVLALSLAHAPEPTEDERSFLLLVARYASQAIERVRLHDENLRARARAEQLYRFATAAVSADTLDQVCEAALDALAAERAAVLLYDADGVLQPRASRGLAGSDDGAMVFPLVTRGRLLGKLAIYSGEPERDVASSIANHLASITARFSAVAALERTIHDNELFAGVLAHDLRNPLGAMMTAAQLLLMRQEGEGDRSAKPLSRILSSGQRITRMIDQLLDFTRARVGGGIAINPRAINLADLCQQALGEIELIYPETKLHAAYIGDLGGTWDPDRLAQIISNLGANASQHGARDGGVRVALDGTHPDTVVMTVHNNGAVPPALLPYLFDPFRGTQHRRDRSRGLGLGLYIVKELVRAHGGTVDVTSTEADGTTFTIRLPRAAKSA